MFVQELLHTESHFRLPVAPDPIKGWWAISCEEVPGAWSWSYDLSECVQSFREAVRLIWEANGHPGPVPDIVTVKLTFSLLGQHATLKPESEPTAGKWIRMVGAAEIETELRAMGCRPVDDPTGETL